ncbi:MAG TPA: hypothetical protein PLZ57_13385 [Pseudobdellovibrionaceae bacterium]|nr:hypothetical protein [Pseudobdellovibrionaceae bacterium]
MIFIFVLSVEFNLPGNMRIANPMCERLKVPGFAAIAEPAARVSNSAGCLETSALVEKGINDSVCDHLFCRIDLQMAFPLRCFNSKGNRPANVEPALLSLSDAMNDSLDSLLALELTEFKNEPEHRPADCTREIDLLAYRDELYRAVFIVLEESIPAVLVS